MKYVAFLRGIMPSNPNLSNQNLRSVFENLGFRNVHSVISSGNIIFEPPADSNRVDTADFEQFIESSIHDNLEFSTSTIIRSQDQLIQMIEIDPFKGLKHKKGSYLLATFFKHPPNINFDLPYYPVDKQYYFTKATENSLFSVMDNSSAKTIDLMDWLEKEFGKEITSRTWLTIQRILKKMEKI